MSIIFGILLFSLLIFVHELGHFSTAKLFGVQVNEFAMFMGPAIYKKQKGETLYSIRCIPFGGYCAMEGEDADSDNPRSFQKAAWWKRLIILVAGATMNFIAGFLLVAIVNSCVFHVVPEIDFLRTGSTLAMEGGLEVGDAILEMDGYAIDSTSDFNEILQRDLNNTEFDVLVRRDGQEILLEDVTMIPQEFEANEEGEAGIFYGIQWAVRRLHPGEILKYSWNDCLFFVESVWMGLVQLLTGAVGLSDMAGPVGIVSMMSDVAQQSPTALDAVMNLLYLGAFIAVNLGVMNLLPFPALDGGRAVCLLLTTAVEAITHKKIDPKYEGYLHMAGMVLLLGLMAVLMFKDIWSLF